MDPTYYSTANIGAKIRALRQERGLTQSALAGKKITRNMLSCIENGTSLPSADTLLYLALQLRVPVGYLFSSDREDDLYLKAASADQFRNAFREGRYEECASLCRKMPSDPEAAHLLLLSEFRIAEKNREATRLSSAARHYRAALEAEATVDYGAAPWRALASFYLKLIDEVTSSIPSVPGSEDMGIPEVWRLFLSAYRFCKTGLPEQAEAILKSRMISDPVFHQMIEAAVAIAKDDPLTAIPLLNRLIPISEDNFYIQYHALEDLEKCFEAMENFREAYSLSKRRIALTERFSN